MNTVRVASATKSGNPLSDQSLVELTLRVMPPATEVSRREVLCSFDEVAA
ncbi:MAG: hypothetical protein ABI265_00970 [Gallionella sp.]